MSKFGPVFFCIALLAAVFMAGWCHAESVIYVAPDGGDGAEGGVDAPLATLEAALAKARTLRADGAEGPVRIVLRGGLYGVTAPVTLTAADSGTEESPLFIEAYPEETPVIHGGARVTGWRVEEGRWVAEIPAGLPEDADLSALWVNGRRATAARTPNATNPAGDFPEDKDFFYTDGPVMVKDAEGKETKSNQAFVYREGELQPWAGLDEAVVVVFHSWETSLHRVEALDTETRTIRFKKAAAWPFANWRGDQWYFVENLLEGLDQPGEWCLSRKAGKIYYLPMPGESPETAEAWVPVAKQLLVVPEGAGPVAHVALRGIHFQYTGWGVGPEGHSDSQAAFSVPAALDLFAARNWVIEDCMVAHVGTYGVWFHQGCQDNLMTRCEITDLGAGGVRIGEGKSPEREEDVAQRNTVDNCFIHDAGRMYRGAVGVWIGRSSYNRVTHNEICDIRYTGVSVGWSWGYAESSANNNLIENNHIHHIAKGQLSDTGGIYTLGLSPGTVLRGNFIHDVLSNPKVSGGWGLYTDEGSTDILLENNIVFNTQTGGFHQHYGKENRVVNNIFAFSHVDQLVRSREEEHISFFFERNIVIYNNGRLLGSTWKNGNFRMANNCYWNLSGEAPDFAGMSLEEWQAAGHDEGSIVADPQFADIEARDFSLPEDSPVMELGFEPLDPFDAGLYGPGAWTDKPGSIVRPARPLPAAK
ncbi:MAG: right-handed parallel beta-helix repeat-containing protein [Candidatus Hydrogenedentes bacterium]|nr:right-handed parallel beta-helix repeat-containing protein [Candidatus Hydrogenedentota bacterium]